MSISPCARIIIIVLAILPQPRSMTRAAAQTSASLVTRSVTVDGLSIRVRTGGLADRRPDQAAIVFEGGGSAPLETWDPVLPRVAAIAPVVAYDRAGTGESSWDELPPTPERISRRLQRLLSTLDVAPPYVLVGHSWGGALVRYFAGQYPEQIAGVLYLDPTDITLTRADLVALFESIGAGAAEYDAFNRTMEQALAAAPAPIRAEAGVIMGLLDRDLADRHIPAQPRVPTSVIVAGRVAAPPSALVRFDAQAYARAMHENQVKRLRSWVFGGGTFDVAVNSGHVIHADDPERVLAAIRHLLTARR